MKRKKLNEKELNIAVHNYLYAIGNRHMSYAEARRRILNHLSGRDFDGFIDQVKGIIFGYHWSFLNYNSKHFFYKL